MYGGNSYGFICNYHMERERKTKYLFSRMEITTFGDDYLAYRKKVFRYIGRKR